MGARSKYTLSQARTFYVVLQGEFALYHEATDNPEHDTLWILAPDIGGHAYKAGPWPSDWQNDSSLNLPSDLLVLKNAFGEKKCEKAHSNRVIPEQNGDLFLRLGPTQLCPGEARVRIKAPMPLAIIPGRMEATPSVFMQVREPGGGHLYPPVARCPTVIPILVYKWYDDGTGCADNMPYLWDGACETRWPAVSSCDNQSIQIFATSPVSDVECQKQHAQKAFHKAAKLLGLNAHIDWSDDPGYTELFSVTSATPPAGLSWVQINCFLYQYYGRPVNDPELIQDGPVSFLTPKFSSSGNCGPTTGGGGGR